MKVKYEIGCKEVNKECEDTYKFSEPHNLGCAPEILNVDDIENFDSVTFYARIESVELEMEKTKSPYTICEPMVIFQILADKEQLLWGKERFMAH